MIWICCSSSCDYEEAHALSRYCPWCCQDLIPACMAHRLPVDRQTGQCTSCGSQERELALGDVVP